VKKKMSIKNKKIAFLKMEIAFLLKKFINKILPIAIL